MNTAAISAGGSLASAHASFAQEPPLTSQQAFICFLLGLGYNLHVRIIGYLPLSELAIALCIPFLLPQLTSRRVMHYARVPLLLGGLWLGTQMLTDLFLQTRFELAARGIARSFVLVVTIPFFVWYLQSQTYKRLIWITAGMIPSLIFSAYVLRPGTIEGREAVLGNAGVNWQTHWVAVAGMINRLVALLFYCRAPMIAYAACASLGSLNILFGSRSAGALPFLAAAAAAGYNAVTGRRLLRRLGVGRMAALAGLILLTVAAVYLTYKTAASSGRLGHDAQTKYERQSSSRFGIMSGGRSEFFIGMLAISESPLVGYGSWPLDTYGFYLRGCELLGEKPISDYYSKGFPVIPAHSHIIGTWTEGGVLAIWFWVYAWFIAVCVFFSPLRHERQLRLWATLNAVSLTWNILFSPVGARMLTAMVLAVFLLELKGNRAASAWQNRARSTRPSFATDKEARLGPLVPAGGSAVGGL